MCERVHIDGGKNYEGSPQAARARLAVRAGRGFLAPAVLLGRKDSLATSQEEKGGDQMNKPRIKDCRCRIPLNGTIRYRGTNYSWVCGDPKARAGTTLMCDFHGNKKMKTCEWALCWLEGTR